MTSVIGALLKQSADPSLACDGRVTIHRWRFEPADEHVHDLAVAIGRIYVGDQARLATPTASVGTKVPRRDTVRAGDFGEMLAMAVYSVRMGRAVPWNRLQLTKPVADATVQGPDTVCLTITPGEDVEPVVVEAKSRTSGNPSDVLPAIAESLSVVTDDYLVSAWAAGAELMLAHPDHERHFAFWAAQHLGRLVDPDAVIPDHLRHAVAVVGADKITKEKVENYWPGAPPVTELHVIEVPDLKAVRDQLLDAASSLTYGDLTGGAAPLVDRGHRAGISGLISPTVPGRLADPEERDPLRIVLESSLWYLADEDGVALARARHVEDHPDPNVKGLAQLLTGALSGAVATLTGLPLEEFARAAQAVLFHKVGPDKLLEAANALAVEDEIEHAARHVAGALLHRLERHPSKLTREKGATGPTVQHVVARHQRFGRHALWPSQAAAVRGGLLDRAQRSLAIKMPTSAGKTALMQLAIADALDSAQDVVVAVLAPTRALVGQLQGDLRGSLPESVAVRSSQGGLDYDTELPSEPSLLGSAGVAVVTPERFDLDWRRATTGDSGVDLDNLRLLVVDEAQLIDNGTRGAALELVIAKTLQRGIRVVLLSSQFSDVHAIANWINGTALESDWRPAWLERLVYLRGPEGTKHTRSREGYLWSEGGDPVQVLDLKPSEKSKGDGVIRHRRHETAAIVQRYEEEGLVVVFTDNKSWAQELFNVVVEQLPESDAVPEALAELADSLVEDHPDEAEALRRGFGLHHADVPRAVKQAIETAARKEGGLLRCIVCTPTLLEGVDFPTRTVVAAYPPQDTSGRPNIARLRNLAGRAGRGGKFTSGRIVVMTKNHKQARKWRRAFRQQLPATETALTSALKEIQRRKPEWLSDEATEILNAITIEALAEASAADGDLRAALEEALEQTVWSATSPPQVQQQVVTTASNYAAVVAARVPDLALRQAFYRTGLKLDSCLALRAEIDAELNTIVTILRNPLAGDDELDGLLHWLIEKLVKSLDELSALQAVDAAGLRGALTKWMQGASETDIEEAHPAAWEALTPRQLETMIPWALTGAFEVTAALAGDLRLRELAHKRLSPVRIRDGVPHSDLCDLVREGADRVRVSRIAAECKDEVAATGRPFGWNLKDAVKRRLEEEAEAPSEADDDAAPDEQLGF